MQVLKSIWKAEPVASANAIAMALEAIIVAAIAFGVDISADQKTALTAMVIALGQTIATIIGRSQVSPTK